MSESQAKALNEWLWRRLMLVGPSGHRFTGCAITDVSLALPFNVSLPELAVAIDRHFVERQAGFTPGEGKIAELLAGKLDRHGQIHNYALIR